MVALDMREPRGEKLYVTGEGGDAGVLRHEQLGHVAGDTIEILQQEIRTLLERGLCLLNHTCGG